MYKLEANVSGLTLIELMISVAIICVLAAIAIPSYQAYRDKANNGMAIADIQLIRGIIERYFVENSKYPASINDIAGSLPNNGLDPWGRAYIYLNIIDGGNGIKGDVRKDQNLSPINTLYDLYSMGKDGVTKKQLDNKDSKDVIVLASDGAFVGLSADF